MSPERERRQDHHPEEHRRGRTRSRSVHKSPHDEDKAKHDLSGHSNAQRSRSRSHSPRRRQHDSASRSRSPSRRKRKHRSRSRSKQRDRRKRKHSRSNSRSSSSASSSDDHRKTKRREKHRKRSTSRSRKEKRKDKKHKKDKKKKKSGITTTATPHWGKYGLIDETDLYNKEPEFRTWLVEERMVNIETLSKDATKKEFARFVEDYNTATLPHEKFYNLDRYEKRMDLLRNGETLPPVDDKYDPNADLIAHTSSHKRRDVERESYLSREQLEDLRRVQQERTQISKMRLLGMDIKQSHGVRMEEADE